MTEAVQGSASLKVTRLTTIWEWTTSGLEKLHGETSNDLDWRPGTEACVSYHRTIMGQAKSLFLIWREKARPSCSVASSGWFKQLYNVKVNIVWLLTCPNLR